MAAEPVIDSWFTQNSAQYARLYANTADEANNISMTTWDFGQGVQEEPVYADIQEISYSDDFVYVLCRAAPGMVVLETEALSEAALLSKELFVNNPRGFVAASQ